MINMVLGLHNESIFYLEIVIDSDSHSHLQNKCRFFFSCCITVTYWSFISMLSI